jgi:selenocysteine lyase/cysteine desulfurase
MRDLKSICNIAHERGALVYADVIQAVGAIPVDFKASGVDFCCGGTYKYLIGEFGVAFLYVRADRLPLLKRVQVGWRQIKSFSTPSWSGLATALGSINYIVSIGIDNIARHRAPMLARLEERDIDRLLRILCA